MATRKQELFGYLLGDTHFGTFSRVDYKDDSGEWQMLDDVIHGSIRASKSSEQDFYGDFSLVPPTGECSFDVLSRDGEYDPRSGSAKADILRRDREIRLYAGYILQDKGDEQTVDIDLTDAHLLGTKIDGGNIVLDIGYSSGVDAQKYIPSLFSPLYDSENYDDSTYAHSSLAVFTIDRTDPRYEHFEKFELEMNSANANIYYRTGKDVTAMELDNTISEWTDAGASVNGTAEVDLGVDGARYLQVAVLFEVYDWQDDIAISALRFYTSPYIEWILIGSYFIDDPLHVEPSLPESPYVEISARDALKKAIETELNIPDLTTGQTLTYILEWCCDAAGIEHDIVDLSSFGDRVSGQEYDAPTHLDEIIKDIMFVIGDDYEVFVNTSNDLVLQAKVSNYFVDGALDYRRYRQARRSHDRGKQLKRMTISNAKESVDGEKILGTWTGTGTGSNVTISTATSAAWTNPAIAKRFTVTPASEVNNVSLVSVGVTSIVFNVASGSSVDIVVYGSEFSGSAPSAVGEAIDYDNTINNAGITADIENVLMGSDSECQERAEQFITNRATPEYRVTVTDTAIRGVISVGDNVLLVSKYLYDTNIYRVVKVDYQFSDNGGFAVYGLKDTGEDFEDYIWDRNGLVPGENDLVRDTGIIWDADIFPLGEDTTDYSYTKEVEFA